MSQVDVSFCPFSAEPSFPAWIHKYETWQHKLLKVWQILLGVRWAGNHSQSLSLSHTRKHSWIDGETEDRHNSHSAFVSGSHEKFKSPTDLSSASPLISSWWFLICCSCSLAIEASQEPKLKAPRYRISALISGRGKAIPYAMEFKLRLLLGGSSFPFGSWPSIMRCYF